MHLPEWLTKLVRDVPHIKRPDDRDFERDQAAVDAKLAPYWNQRYPEQPPDPRVLDPSRLAALRDRLLYKYAYRWRQVEAIDEIVDALFEPIIQSNGTRLGLGTNIIFLNAEGESPDPSHRVDPDEYRKFYYITVHGYRLGEFLTSFEDARRLLTSVLPEWGFTARVQPGRTEVRLERGDQQEQWIGGATIETLIVAGMLDLLARRPEEAKPWRSL